MIVISCIATDIKINKEIRENQGISVDLLTSYIPFLHVGEKRHFFVFKF